MDSPVKVYQNTISETLEYDGVPVLTCSIDYPMLQSENPELDVETPNLYYRERAMLRASYCRSYLYQEAVAAYQESLQQGYPFHPHELISTYQVTLLNDHYFSLYMDSYLYTGGANGSTTRFSNVWDLQAGSILVLKDFFPTNPNYEEEIIRAITHYIGELERTGGNMEYFENYRQNVARTFNRNNFHLTPSGIVVFFQPYDIAPHSSGIPSFLIPMGL